MALIRCCCCCCRIASIDGLPGGRYLSMGSPGGEELSRTRSSDGTDGTDDEPPSIDATIVAAGAAVVVVVTAGIDETIGGGDVDDVDEAEDAGAGEAAESPAGRSQELSPVRALSQECVPDASS